MKIAVIAAMVMVVVLSLAFVGSAQAQSCGQVVMGVSPSSGMPGDTVTVSGTGALGNYTLYWGMVGGQVLASASADQYGAFSSPIMIPADAAQGAHDVVFDGTDEQEAPAQCVASVTVTPQPEQPQAEAVQETAPVSVLPSTGYALMAPATVLLLLGGGATLRRKRR